MFMKLLWYLHSIWAAYPLVITESCLTSSFLWAKIAFVCIRINLAGWWIFTAVWIVPLNFHEVITPPPTPVVWCAQDYFWRHLCVPLNEDYFISLTELCPIFMSCSYFPLTVASWFLSPLLSGLMSAVLFYFVRMFILQKVRTGNLSLSPLACSLSMSHIQGWISVMAEVPQWGRSRPERWHRNGCLSSYFVQIIPTLLAAEATLQR